MLYEQVKHIDAAPTDKVKRPTDIGRQYGAPRGMPCRLRPAHPDPVVNSYWPHCVTSFAGRDNRCEVPPSAEIGLSVASVDMQLRRHPLRLRNSALYQTVCALHCRKRSSPADGHV